MGHARVDQKTSSVNQAELPYLESVVTVSVTNVTDFFDMSWLVRSRDWQAPAAAYTLCVFSSCFSYHLAFLDFGYPATRELHPAYGVREV